MSTIQNRQTTQPTAQCPHCRNEFDALAAGWCRCVGKQISLVCTNCEKCFCDTGTFARRFWNEAPAELVQARLAEQQHRGELVVSRNFAAEVLVVDDDEEIRLMAAYTLEQMGYDVAVAADAQEAFVAIDRCKPKVILTDALMPRLDGRQFCRLIKAIHPDLKVVIMTSLYTSPRYKYEAFRTFRADDYLPKPFDAGRLQTIFDRLLPREASLSPEVA